LGVAVELRPRHVKVGPAGPGGRTGPRTEEPGPKPVRTEFFGPGPQPYF
jgi:hypothetical protein